MKLGIYLNSQHRDTDDAARRVAETLEQARLIAALGFDSIWAGEHHVTPGFHYFPQLLLLQQAAAVAEGLWVGTNLILLPLHNPIELAETAAFMDVVTGGRFMFGVGLGYRPEEFAIYGIPMSERVSRLIEGIDIVRRLWSEDRVTHLGRHWQFHDASIRPRPLQSPRPPILIGAQVEAAIARAARIADGWLAVPVPRLDEIAEQVTLFASTRAAANLAPSRHVCRLIEVSCARDEDQAFRRAAPYLLEKYASYATWGLQDVALDRNVNPEQQLRRLAADRFAIGTPAQVADMLIAQHRVGITHAAMRVSWPGMPQDDILAGIEMLGRDVLPHVRRRTGQGVDASG
jgi:alkanesulfonate monooxygenase SsuD/methylene tetrahydromethanopterin reductase-like flavin-dependent oxidoreductase (luciferase family)